MCVFVWRESGVSVTDSGIGVGKDFNDGRFSELVESMVSWLSSRYRKPAHPLRFLLSFLNFPMKIHEMEQGLINFFFFIIYLSFPSGFKVGPDLTHKSQSKTRSRCDIGRRVVGPGLVFCIVFVFVFLMMVFTV